MTAYSCKYPQSKVSSLAGWIIFNMSSSMITIYSPNQLLKESSERAHLGRAGLEEYKRPSHRIIEFSELEGIQGSSSPTLKGFADTGSNLLPWHHWHHTQMGRCTKPETSNKIKYIIFRRTKATPSQLWSTSLLETQNIPFISM